MKHDIVGTVRDDKGQTPPRDVNVGGSNEAVATTTTAAAAGDSPPGLKEACITSTDEVDGVGSSRLPLRRTDDVGDKSVRSGSTTGLPYDVMTSNTSSKSGVTGDQLQHQSHLLVSEIIHSTSSTGRDVGGGGDVVGGGGGRRGRVGGTDAGGDAIGGVEIRSRVDVVGGRSGGEIEGFIGEAGVEGSRSNWVSSRSTPPHAVTRQNAVVDSRQDTLDLTTPVSAVVESRHHAPLHRLVVVAAGRCRPWGWRGHRVVLVG